MSNGSGSAVEPHYEWRYEYYGGDEEPVSFEGLAAHRYSIVIGFWVGLAVFVIFMFFVLTLLTKTGAPHPECGEKRAHLTSCVEDLNLQTRKSNAAYASHPLLDSRSVFQCSVNEEEEVSSRAPCPRAGTNGGPKVGPVPAGRSRLCCQGEASSAGGNMVTSGTALLANFDIPNFVQLEHSSTPGEDDLLLGGSQSCQSS